MKLHHIGIVCKKDDINNFLFSDKIEESIVDKNQNNNLFFSYDKNKNIWIEFVCPINEKSTVYNYLKKKGPGLHHLGYEVNDIELTINKYKEKNNFIFINKYIINIPCFGGAIRTAFFFNNNVILEFLSIDEK
jgi:hypothetical protein